MVRRLWSKRCFSSWRPSSWSLEVRKMQKKSIKPLYIVFDDDGDPWSVHEDRREAESCATASGWRFEKYVPAK